MTSQERVARTDGSIFTDPGQDGKTSRMFMRGVGVSPDLLTRRPVIGVASAWSELVPCNLHHRELAAAVKRGVLDSGGVAFEFPTISLGEPFVRPTSMYLRNLMAMDVEEMIASSPIDGVVLIGGCDKSIPAQLMGACSAGKPAVLIASGPRGRGFCLGQERSIEDLWPILDAHRRGELTDAQWLEVEGALNEGPGTCNVMGTASTMAAVAECLGFSLPYSSWTPASAAARHEFAERTGAQAVTFAHRRITPNFLVTEAAIANAYRVIAAVGGSTNALIHLRAIAGRMGICPTFEQVAGWLAHTPQVLHVQPTGTALLEDADRAGGLPAVLARLGSLLDTRTLCGSGEPWSDALAALVARSDERDVPSGAAVSPALVMLRGSLAPGGAVIKRAGADASLLRHRGPAAVFDGVEDLNARIDDETLGLTPDSVLVLRGVGPIGGPGMPEVGAARIPRYLQQRGTRDMLRVSDARMSGTASGACALHVVPEAAAGGPISLVRDGDMVEIDAESGRLDLLVSAAELDRRRSDSHARSAASTARQPSRGYLRLHDRHVLQADQGCDLDLFVATKGAS